MHAAYAVDFGGTAGTGAAPPKSTLCFHTFPCPSCGDELGQVLAGNYTFTKPHPLRLTDAEFARRRDDMLAGRSPGAEKVGGGAAQPPQSLDDSMRVTPGLPHYDVSMEQPPPSAPSGIAELAARLREQCQWKTDLPCERDIPNQRCVSCRAADALELFAGLSGVPRDAPTGLTTEEWDAVRELRQGGGTYYVTQERAFAPGIAGEWPAVIPKPKSKHGRLVRRTWARTLYAPTGDNRQVLPISPALPPQTGNPAPERERLERIIGFAQEIQRATPPGDAQQCARHVEYEAKAALRGVSEDRTPAPPEPRCDCDVCSNVRLPQGHPSPPEWPASRCMECGGGWDAAGKVYVFNANCCREDQHDKLAWPVSAVPSPAAPSPEAPSGHDLLLLEMNLARLTDELNRIPELRREDELQLAKASLDTVRKWRGTYIAARVSPPQPEIPPQ